MMVSQIAIQELGTMRGSTKNNKTVSHDEESLSRSERGDDSLSNGTLTKSSSAQDGTLSRDEDRHLPLTQQLQALYMSRLGVAFMLLLVISGAGVVTYFMTNQSMEENLDIQFENAAGQLLDHAHQVFNNAVDVYVTMASAMVGFGASNDDNNNWPFFTQPNFETFGQSFLQSSGADVVSWSPLINGEAARVTWGNYSAMNDAWIKDGLTWQAANLGIEMPEGPFDAPEEIYRKTSSEKQDPEFGSGPFLPVWQMAGAPADPSVVNYNLLSDEIFAFTYQGVLTQEAPALSTVVEDASWYYGNSAAPTDVEGKAVDMPQGLLLTPIKAPETKDVIGTVVAVLSWNTFFDRALKPGTPLIDVVVATECGDTFTLAVNGHHVKYIGKGDHHDKDCSHMGLSTQLAVEETRYMTCGYKVSVYPSGSFVGTYENNQPVLWSLFVVGIMLLVAIVFFGYDLYVQKRHVKAVHSTAKINAVISNLFPAEVRDRLFGNNTEKNVDPKPRHKSRLSTYLNKDSHDQNSEDGEMSASDHPLNKSKRQEEAVPNAQVGVDMYETKPIADLFPNTTIMFADIAGFTAWSSVREPSQVFTLLETVYQSFDGIAKRRKVFKVETVGDCYVAVAGLPEPRPDHALVMAKFSRECVDKFNELVRQLELSLGPDTGDLAMRAGLHSGPVTAGVLRGDKSRFQLFGDTVNVAARIEGTGMRNRIHMSAETAYQLIKLGKEHWCRKRPELVTAKGKTTIQTYWLQSPSDSVHDEQLLNPETKAFHKDLPLDDLEDALPPKVKRLVGWNVEILKKLLQQIVAKREASGKKRADAQITKIEALFAKKHYLLDEVTEIIPLPKFDVRAHRKKAEKTELDPVVVDQLKLYVSAVAAMHQENPFHNFEHASHVTMSVSKLLARIVAPDEVMLQEEDDAANLAASLHDHTYGITSDPLTQFACVLSALIHDTDHAGVSNFQLVKEGASIAKFFKEKSVAEQNSIALAWDKLMDPRFAELRKCIYAEPSELARFRQLIVNNVLATDIFDKELTTLRKNRWDKAFQRHAGAGVSMTSDKDVADDINRKATVVMEHLIQASDVAHTMQHWHIYQKWNERLFAEMMTAYKAGRMGSDPSSNWYQGELGFFDNYIIPLANKLKECGIFGVSSDEYLNYALENRREWANKGEDVVAKYMQKYCEAPEDDGDAGDDEASTAK